MFHNLANHVTILVTQTQNIDIEAIFDLGSLAPFWIASFWLMPADPID